MAKFSQKVAGGLIAAVRLGAPREAACASAGITSLTLRSWLAAANDGDKRYAEFAEEFRREEANFERHLIASILKAGQSDWKAHAWILERKNKADWSMRTELTGADGEGLFAATPERAADAVRRAFGQHAAIQADSVSEDAGDVPGEASEP